MYTTNFFFKILIQYTFCCSWIVVESFWNYLKSRGSAICTDIHAAERVTKDSLALSKTEFEIGLSSILERERECVNMQKASALQRLNPFLLVLSFEFFWESKNGKGGGNRHESNPFPPSWLSVLPQIRSRFKQRLGNLEREADNIFYQLPFLGPPTIGAAIWGVFLYKAENFPLIKVLPNAPILHIFKTNYFVRKFNRSFK